MRPVVNFVICCVVIGAAVSSFFATSYESLKHSGVKVEYQSSIDVDKARQVAEVIASPALLGGVDELHVILDEKGGRNRLWFGVKSGAEKDQELLDELSLVTNVVANECYDANSFEFVLCSSDRKPMHTISPTPGYDQLVKEEHNFLFYSGIAEEEARTYLTRIRETGLLPSNGICRVAKENEHLLAQLFSNAASLSTFTDQNTDANASIIQRAVFEGQTVEIQYGLGPDSIWENMTRTLQSIGWADQKAIHGDLTIEYGAPLTSEDIDRVAKRLQLTGLQSGSSRITTIENDLEFRVVKRDSVSMDQALAYFTFYAREVKSVLPQYNVTVIVSDGYFRDLCSAFVESGNGDHHNIGNNSLFTSGDLSQEQIDDCASALEEWQLFSADSGHIAWLVKSGENINMSLVLIEPNDPNEDFQQVLVGLQGMAKDIDGTVYPDLSFGLSICTLDGDVKKQLWPVAE